MNSLPLPSASPKAKEPSDDASETAPMPKSNAGMTEQQQQQQEEEAPAKNSVLDTSAILFENAEIEHKYNKEHLADSEFHRGASISVVSTSRPTRLTIFIPELTERLFSFILQFQSWSTAHPTAQLHSRATETQRRLDAIKQREDAQEQIRQNFGNFLNMVRTALVVMGSG